METEGLQERLQDLIQAVNKLQTSSNADICKVVLSRAEDYDSVFDNRSLNTYSVAMGVTDIVELAKMEAYVELVEALDCGSIGGFGKGYSGGRDLASRYRWLCEKYLTKD